MMKRIVFHQLNNEKANPLKNDKAVNLNDFIEIRTDVFESEKSQFVQNLLLLLLLLLLLNLRELSKQIILK